MKNKQPKITNTMQKVAVDILEDIEAYMMSVQSVPQELLEIFNKYKKKYELCEDPFTQMICTTKEWAKNRFDYYSKL